jgi:tellurite resistance protein
MTGDVDAFARILFNTALFTAMLVATMYRRFLGIRFFLSWWAYSFPLAALAIASMLMARTGGLLWHRGLAWLLLAALAAVMVALLARTAMAVARAEICEPE